jgi:acyl-CoA thioesterase-1
MGEYGWLKSIAIIIIAIVVLYAASLAELYSQLGRYKNYWERNNQSASPSGGQQYVALGDSTAQGIGASKPSRGYVGIISRDLSSRRGQPVDAINLSKSGAKVRDVLDRQIPAMKLLNITGDTVVTMEIGANDMIDFDASKFEKEMDGVMSQLPRQALITDLPYFSGSRYRSKEANVQAANKIMYRLAAKYHFELLPLHERMKQEKGIRTFAPDFFHPSDYAYRHNWAYVFLQRLK